jgi:hypothetical protein
MGTAVLPPHYRTLRHVALGLVFPLAYQPHQQPPWQHHSSTRLADHMNTQLVHKKFYTVETRIALLIASSRYTQIVSRDFLAEPFRTIASLGLRYLESTPPSITHKTLPRLMGGVTPSCKQARESASKRPRPLHAPTLKQGLSHRVAYGKGP